MTPRSDQPAIVVGAGIGGLCAALRLAHDGRAVTVLERAAAPGGKMRAVPTAAGPCDAGPTVLTLRGVLDTLFEAVGERLDDHVTLEPLPVIARHFWVDGTRLDLSADPGESRRNVAAAFGSDAAARFARYAAGARRLFEAFEPPMRAPDPSVLAIAGAALRRPGLMRDMAPHRSLASHARAMLGEPRLAQLIGRYATYVGGSPFETPAILGLVSHVEALGVWRVAEGMHALPRAIERLAQARGARFLYGQEAREIAAAPGGITVRTDAGSHTAPDVVFNGDPRALRLGLLGPEPSVPHAATEPRSLSACVMAFAARADGLDLSHHNVFFGDEAEEFGAIAAGRLPARGTLYLCAQDAGPGPRRFEIILNAPAGLHLSEEEKRECATSIMDRLEAFGLRMTTRPGPDSLMAPTDWAAMFPGSEGAIYGRSPHGLMAALARPRVRASMLGLYLAGGGVHPGAGVPMAALSGTHAAEAILADRPSTSPSRRVGTLGGISTASRTAAPVRSPSSAS